MYTYIPTMLCGMLRKLSTLGQKLQSSHTVLDYRCTIYGISQIIVDPGLTAFQICMLPFA